MLAVAEIHYIRYEANQKGCSYSDIAKRMNRDPRTVKKYAEMEDFNPSKVKQTRKAKVMDPVKPILDQCVNYHIIPSETGRFFSNSFGIFLYSSEIIC